MFISWHLSSKMSKGSRVDAGFWRALLCAVLVHV